MTISSRANDVRSRRPQAKIGQPAEADYLNRIRSVVNSDPQADQVSTIVVDTAANSTAYAVTINGVEVSITSDASATKAEIADALADAINEEPLVRGQLAAASDGVDTVTLTGEYPGASFTLTDTDANLTTALVTSAAEADAIPFGRLVVSGGYQSDEANLLGILAASSAFDAQVDTLTVDFAAAEEYLVTIAIDGEAYTVKVAASVDDATTAAAIVAAINAMMPANTVLASSAGAVVTLTAEVAGKAFKTSIGLVSGTAARLVLAHSTSGDSTDINALAVGVSVYTTDESVTEVEGTEVVYPANAGVIVLHKGLIWVESAESVSRGDAVYVELGVSADNGKFFATSSATRVKLAGAKWERDARASSGDDLAIVRIDL